MTAGPAEWVGADVFGASGELGFMRDGTHAEYVVARRPRPEPAPRRDSRAAPS